MISRNINDDSTLAYLFNKGDKKVDALRADLINLIYPVGSIYMSVNSASPERLFGGKWEQIKGRFLLGADDTYNAGTVGGEATHTLTVNEMPAHDHAQYANVGNAATGQTNLDDICGCNNINAQNALIGDRRTTKEGGGAAHNNMPPFLAVYVWKRTA